MNLIISFSGRSGGNCDRIADFIASGHDRVVTFRSLKVHPCSDCGYECFDGICKYRDDDCYALYASMPEYDRVILVVPMYCGNPSSLYFIFNERCQDFFMHNDCYDEIAGRLYIIGVYGSAAESPDFVPCLLKWFNGTPYINRVLGIERHAYGQKLGDCVLEVPEIKEKIKLFLE